MALSDATVARMLARFGVLGADTPVAVAGGHINDSFLVRGRGPFGPGRFLLQRLNPAVFPAGAAVVANAAHVAAHLAGAAADRGWSAQQWRVARPLAAEDGMAGAQDETGAWWRVFPYLEGTRAIDRARAPAEAHEIGRAFGVFHDLMAGYDGPSLVETLPGFHDTPARLARLEVVAQAASPALGRTAGAQLAFALNQRAWAGLLAGRDLPRRVVHNDAKAANALLDAATGLAVTVVDLDTVMHGTLLHDIGDLIRSTVVTAAEDAEAGTAVASDRGLFGALMGGFVRGLGALELAPLEWELVVPAGLVITYEQGIRFLTDFLEGDRYYRVTRAGQNLDRARVQFRLAAAIAADALALEGIVTAARRRAC